MQWAALCLCVLLVVATAASIVLHAGSWMPPLDDAYIHAAFARELALGRSSLPGQGAGGESSPGYALLLLPAEWGPLAFAPQWALLLGALALVLLPRLVPQLSSQASSRGVVAMACALGGPLLFHAQSGMETLPYLTLGVGSLGAFACRRFRLAGLLAALAAWLRLDAWTLWLALGLGCLDDARAKGASFTQALRQSASVLWPGLLLAGSALVSLAILADGFPPPTLAGRRWLAGLSPQWSPSGVGAGVFEFARDWLRALSAQFALGNLAPLLPEQFGGGFALLRRATQLATSLLLLDGLRRVALVKARAAEAAAARLFVLWTVLTVVQYAVLLPSRGHAGRYQPQILLGCMLLAAVAARAWWPRRILRPLIALVALGALAGSLQAVRLSGLAAGHLATVHRRAVHELPAHVPATAKVAAFDIGVVAYEARFAWIDLSGLCDRELWAAVESGRTLAHLRERGATHVLLPLTENDAAGSLRDRLRLNATDGVELEPVAEWASSDRQWAEAFQFSGNAARRLVLYALP
jgi:hypothetical protein